MVGTRWVSCTEGLRDRGNKGDKICLHLKQILDY
nr:MAG TPA: hypothetical protein [Bacteriophage sp.]